MKNFKILFIAFLFVSMDGFSQTLNAILVLFSENKKDEKGTFYDEMLIK